MRERWREGEEGGEEAGVISSWEERGGLPLDCALLVPFFLPQALCLFFHYCICPAFSFVPKNGVDGEKGGLMIY